nr:MAG TPA: tail assembly chaperone [Caudoviricetes sp.]
MATTIKKATKTVQLGDLELDLKLGGREIFKIERRLGKSMLSLFMDSQGGNKLPPVNEILIVLQGANQNHGVTDKRVIEAFEQYLVDGHTTMDLFNELMELFDESGFFGKKKKKGTKTNTESEEVTLDSVETTEDELM